MSDKDICTEWYVAKIKSGMTSLALESLNRKSISYLYPTMKIEGREEPLIPGYVLLNLHGTKYEFSEVNSVRGIDGMLPLRSEVACKIPNSWMAGFEQRLLAGEFNIKAESAVLPRFRKNEILRISSGPLSGHTGTFVRVIKGAVELSITFLGQLISIRLNGHQVQQTI